MKEAISAMECAAQWRRALELLRITVDAEVGNEYIEWSNVGNAREIPEFSQDCLIVD